MNTLQGSLIVLGCKDATELPDTKGRGIWSLGNRKEEIQAPFISDVDIVEKCSRVKAEYAKGFRKMFSALYKADSKVPSTGNLRESVIQRSDD
jgi:hypothetical protein